MSDFDIDVEKKFQSNFYADKDGLDEDFGNIKDANSYLNVVS